MMEVIDYRLIPFLLNFSSIPFPDYILDILAKILQYILLYRYCCILDKELLTYIFIDIINIRAHFAKLL